MTLLHPLNPLRPSMESAMSNIANAASPSRPVPSAVEWGIGPGELEQIRPGRFIHLRRHPGGARADTTVFLCHGAGGNKHQWRHQWHALVEAGYRVVAWDILGHGQSPRPRDRTAYAAEALVDDYLQLISTFGSRRNVLVGHSYGARLTLATLLALQREGRLGSVERALLLGTPPVSVRLARGLLAWLPVPVLETLRPLLARGFRRQAWHPEADRGLVAHEEAVARHNSLRVFKALLAGATPIDAGTLAGLDLPVRLLAGDADGLTPAVHAHALAERLPRAELRIIPDCGHQIMLERPAETNAELASFLTAA